MSFGDIAYPLTKLGIYVVPAHPGKKRSFLQEWQRRGSIDPRQIDYWDKTYPDGNVIVVCGPQSDISVIDIDVKGDVDGCKALEDHKNEGRILPPRPMVRSPSGGLHLYFKHQPGLTNAQSISKTGRGLGAGVDYRAAGGCACGPGSTTDEGRYSWIGEAPTSPESFPRLPFWAIKRLRHKRRTFNEVRTEITGNFSFILKSVLETEPSRRNGMVYWAANRLKDENAPKDAYEQLIGVCHQIAVSDDPPPVFIEQCRNTICSANPSLRGAL